MENPVQAIAPTPAVPHAGFQQLRPDPRPPGLNSAPAAVPSAANSSKTQADASSLGRDVGPGFVSVPLPLNAGQVAALPDIPFAAVTTATIDLTFKAPQIPIYNRRFSVNELRAKGIIAPSIAAPKRVRPPDTKKPTVPRKDAKVSPAKNAHAGQSPAQSPETLSSESESDSDYSSDEYEEMPEPDVAKDHFLFAFGKRVIEGVWSYYPRLDTKTIQEKLRNFNAIVQELQEAYTKAADAETKASKAEDELGRKKAVNEQKILLEKMRFSLEMLVKNGHREVVECVPQHIKLLVTLRQWLVTRISANDYNGPLPVQLLKLFANHMVIPLKDMEKIKLDKVLTRYTKKDNGDDTTKPLAKRILENTKSGEMKPEGAAKAESKPADPKIDKTDKVEKVDKTEKPKSPPPISGVKREREADNASNAPKRQAVQATMKSTAPVKPEPKKVEPVKKPATSIATTTGNAMKTKTVTAPAKPQGAFSHLRSLAAPPAKTPAVPAAAAAAAAAAPSSSAATGFSFAAAMASLHKKEEDAAAVKAAPAPVETEEQKKKRLRREARGNLRVRFKPDGELEAVKLFYSDAAERAYRKMGGSIKNSDEGKALKEHKESAEEDDDRENEEVSLIAWRGPVPIDFEDLEVEELLAKNYISRGGPLEPDSEEKTRVAADHALAPPKEFFYESRSELPSSPDEPHEPLAQAPVPSTEFGIPKESQQRVLARNLASNPNATSAYMRVLPASWEKEPPKALQPPKQDFSALEALFAQFAKPVAPAVTAAPAFASGDFNLGSLQQLLAGQQAPQQAAPVVDYLAQLAQMQQQTSSNGASAYNTPTSNGNWSANADDEDEYEPQLEMPDISKPPQQPEWQPPKEPEQHRDWAPERERERRGGRSHRNRSSKKRSNRR